MTWVVSEIGLVIFIALVLFLLLLQLGEVIKLAVQDLALLFFVVDPPKIAARSLTLTSSSIRPVSLIGDDDCSVVLMLLHRKMTRSSVNLISVSFS